MDCRRTLDACVGNDNMHGPELPNGLRHHGVDLIFLRDICLKGCGPATGAHDLVDHGCGFVARSRTRRMMNYDRGSPCGEPRGNRPA
jgi:hypothetical protein